MLSVSTNVCELPEVLKHHPDLMDEATKAMHEKDGATETDVSPAATSSTNVDESAAIASNVGGDGDCERGSSHNTPGQNIIHLDGDGQRPSIPENLTEAMRTRLIEAGNGVTGSWGREWGDGVQPCTPLKSRSTSDEREERNCPDGDREPVEPVVRQEGEGGADMTAVGQGHPNFQRADNVGEDTGGNRE